MAAAQASGHPTSLDHRPKGFIPSIGATRPTGTATQRREIIYVWSVGTRTDHGPRSTGSRPHIWVSSILHGKSGHVPGPRARGQFQLPVTCVRDQHTCRHAHSSRVDIRHGSWHMLEDLQSGRSDLPPQRLALRGRGCGRGSSRLWVFCHGLPSFSPGQSRLVDLGRRVDTLLTQNARRRFFSVQLPPFLLRDPVKAEQRMREQLSGRVQQPKTAHKGAALWLTVARLLAVNERHLSDSVTVPCTRTRDAR